MKSSTLRMEYLISYDIENNKIRTRLFKELEKHGLKSIQKSVFWGYLTQAELRAIERYTEDSLKDSDKVFITHTNFNGRGQSYFQGHNPDDFVDWEETLVI